MITRRKRGYTWFQGVQTHDKGRWNTTDTLGIESIRKPPRTDGKHSFDFLSRHCAIYFVWLNRMTEWVPRKSRIRGDSTSQVSFVSFESFQEYHCERSTRNHCLHTKYCPQGWATDECPQRPPQWVLSRIAKIHCTQCWTFGLSWRICTDFAVYSPSQISWRTV